MSKLTSVKKNTTREPLDDMMYKMKETSFRNKYRALAERKSVWMFQPIHNSKLVILQDVLTRICIKQELQDIG